MKENNPQTPELISRSSASSTFACAFLSSSFCFVICASVMLNWGLTYWYTVDTPSDSHQSFLLRRLDVSKLPRLQRKVKSLALKGSISGCTTKNSATLSHPIFWVLIHWPQGWIVGCYWQLEKVNVDFRDGHSCHLSKKFILRKPSMTQWLLGDFSTNINFWVRSRLPHQNAKPTAKRGDCWD